MVKQYDYLYNREIDSVQDLATARYLLKVANEYYFAMEHMREQVDREMQRSEGENSDHKLKLVLPYLPKFDELGEPIEYTHLPAILPSNLPARVTEAFSYLSEQMSLERARANAELADECASMQEVYDSIMALVFEWFASEVNGNAAWLCGRHSITLAGCTMSCYGNSVIIDEWQEINDE